MKSSFIRLSSVTYAIRAQKLLEQHGIRSTVRKLSKDISSHGCGYALEINGDVRTAVAIVEATGIKVVEIIWGE